MLIEEAKWFGQKISVIDPARIFPMLDVGSSTEEARRRIQPWIDEYVFKPIREMRQKVVHLDIKKGKGVDIVGDLSNPCFFKKVSGMRFNSVFCTNLLEHVRNREEICQALEAIILKGGYFFISCPRRYPFHPDPIDTMFRPNIKELAGMFSGMCLIFGEEINCGTHFDYLIRNSKVFLKTIIRLFLPFYNPKGWFITLARLPWLFKNLQVTCLVLKK